jgi:precorrin-2 dehydrogenase/sirohydrochlorin ferrochelatase/precorrin-6A/cobalt-precorrin-6A reductase
MDESKLKEYLSDFDTVVDATHPYAVLVTENLRSVCNTLNIRYLRLIRPQTADNGFVRVPSATAAAAYLNTVSGNALLTTGSKELSAFTVVDRFETRLFARVLPGSDVVKNCEQLGFRGANLICMQGPFSVEMNLATLNAANARYLVTKDSGAAGGLPEKLEAAEMLGVKVIMISRPTDAAGLPERGLSIAEIVNQLIGVDLTPGFPLFVQLAGKKCVVVGGGAVGLRRTGILIDFGATVTLISPKLRNPIDELTATNRLTYIAGQFDPVCLDGAFLAVAATDSRDVNHLVALECLRRGIFVSVADCPGECTFFFPAVCKTDNISAGLVSRNGDHALAVTAAKNVRQVLRRVEQTKTKREDLPND